MDMSLNSIPIYAIEANGDWVTKIDVPAIEETGDSPFTYPLVDYQERILDGEIHSYRNSYQCVYDASRVEDASLYLTELHQGSQRLLIHELCIIRNGLRIDALDPENISAIQRERSLESHIVDNTITVSISVDDVREGDHIQYRSTVIETSNEHPFHGKHFYANYPLSWGCPVTHQSVRVVNESSKTIRSLEGKLQEGKQHYERADITPNSEYSVSYQDLQNELIPDSAPSWVWGSFLQLSTEIKWPELSQYLYQYYQQSGAIEAMDVSDIEALELFDSAAPLATKALAVMRFVQNSVRYRGENHGVFTHTPKSPQRTLKKRAGDCKDKSNLMVSMLLALGVDARLVLVHTRFGKKTAELNPSPYHFNHMIVEVSLGGNTHYIDATIQKQQGDFDHLGELDYGFALPLSDIDNQPVNIEQSIDKEVFQLKHEFDLPRDAAKQVLRVERRYALHRADNMRAYFARNEKSHCQQNFLDWAKDDTGLELETIKPVEVVHDDVMKNELVAKEEYAIVDLARTHKDKTIKITTDFYREFPISSDTSYEMRIDLDGEIEHQIIANYDTVPELEPTQKRISTAAFKYQDKVYCSGKKIVYLTRVKPLRRSVPAGEAAKKHKENVEAMYQRSGNQITHRNPNRYLSGFEKLAANAVLWGILAFVGLALYSWLIGG